MLNIEEMKYLAFSYENYQNSLWTPGGLQRDITQEQRSANSLIKNISIHELSKYFSNIIKKHITSINESCLRYYNERINYINVNHFTEDLEDEVSSFKTSVDLIKRNDISVFRKALTKCKIKNIINEKEKINFLTSECMNYFKSDTNSLAKILMLYKFEEQVKASLFNEGLFEIFKSKKSAIIQSRPTLEELFLDSEKYILIVKILVSKKVILKTNEDYYVWMGATNFIVNNDDLNHDQYSKLKKLKLLIAFGFILTSKGLLKSITTNVDLSYALTSTFKLNVGAAYLGQVFDEFTCDTNSKAPQSLYIKFFQFLD